MVREGPEKKAIRGEASSAPLLPNWTLNYGLPRALLFSKGPWLSLMSLSELPNQWSEAYKCWKIWTPSPPQDS